MEIEKNIFLFKTYIIIFIFLMTLNIFFTHSSFLNFYNFITYFPFIILYFPLSFYFDIKKITNINFLNLLFLKFDNILSTKEIFTLDLKRHKKLLNLILLDNFEMFMSNKDYFKSLILKYNEKSLYICDNPYIIRYFIFNYYLPFINSLLEDKNKVEPFFDYMIKNLNFYQFSEVEFKNIIQFQFFDTEKLDILNSTINKNNSFKILIAQRIMSIQMNDF